MKTKLTKSLSLVLGFMAVVCFAFAITFTAKKPSAYATELITADIQAEYKVGDAFTLPETVEISIDGTNKVTGSNGILIFPDGTAHDSSSYVLEMTGEYEAVYYGTYNNQSIRASKTFIVRSDNWVLSSARSTAEYSTELSLHKDTNNDGLNINLTDGDVFIFDQRINLYELAASTGSDTVQVVSLIPNLVLEGNDKVACHTISIKIVDYYNPDNFIEFIYWIGGITLDTKPTSANYGHYNGTGYTYAGASGQEYTGLEYYSSMTSDKYSGVVNGQIGRLWRHTDPHKLKAAYGQSSVGMYQMRVYSQTVDFWYNINNHVISSKELAVGSANITDLDDTSIYPTNAFKGFTTGEVYVQLQCYNYEYGNPVNLQVTNILGVTGEALNKAKVVDTVKPVLKFENEYTDDTGIYITKDKEYTLPSVEVYDINYLGDMDVALYYNYDSENPVSIYVKNGKFTPTLLGKYTAVYTARDYYGNETIERFDFNSITDKPFTCSENKLAELTANAVNTIPTVSVTGINGDITTKVSVIDPAGNVIDVTKTMSFIPEYLGNYEIVYTFSDNAYTESFKYTVESKDKGEVNFKDELKVPMYFIKNATYDLDDYYAYTATAEGLEAHLADLKVSIDGAEFVAVQDPNAFLVTASNSVVFKAVYEGKEKQFGTCNVVDVKYGESAKEYSKFFQGNHNSVNAENAYIQYNFTNSPMGYLTFINPVLYSSFRFEFTIPAESATNVSGITVAIVEYGNSSNVYNATYYNVITNGSIGFRLTDNEGKVLLDSEVKGKLDGKHSIFVNGGVLTTSEGATYTLPAMSDARIYFGLGVMGTGDFSVQVSRINNQNFNGRVKETNEAVPEIYYNRIYTTNNIGDIVQIPSALVVSVLSPVLQKDVTVSVTNQKGDQYISNGTMEYKELDTTKVYELELTYVGVFRVRYNYKANTGTRTKSEETSYVINCADNIDPTIVFDEGINENTLITMKVGNTHIIKGFTVSDNLTSTEDLFTRVLIYNENYSTVAYDVMGKFNGEYTFNQTGNYIVSVYCQDAVGNYSIATYSISVVEKM